MAIKQSIVCVSIVCILFASGQAVRAAGPLTAAPGNAKWNYALSAHKATFLGSDQPGAAVLELKKSAVLGGSLEIQSDAQAIRLLSGAAPELIIAVPAKSDGATTKLKLDGGDDPHLTINDAQSPRLQGKWIQQVRDQSASVTVQLDSATFATVTMDLPAASADATPEAVPLAGTAGSPTKDLLHDVPPARLIASEKQFASGVERPCAHCSGTGSVTSQVQVGQHKEGSWWVPDYRDQSQTCPICNGTGKVRASDEVLRRLSNAFLRNLAHLDQSNDGAQDAISQSYDMITRSMIGNFKTWAMLNQNGRSVLSRPSPENGTPVIAQVEVLKCDEAQGGRKDFVVRLIGTDQQVHVMNPVSADRIASGFALMGGFVDNALVESGGTKKTPVIANGFLVAPPIAKTWYWWWDWRWNGHA